MSLVDIVTADVVIVTVAVVILEVSNVVIVADVVVVVSVAERVIVAVVNKFFIHMQISTCLPDEPLFS